LLGFPYSGNFSFDIFECVVSISVEVWMSKGPTLFDDMITSRYGAKGKTYMLPKLIVVGIFDLVEIVLVQLSDETGKVGMLEHAR